MSTHFHPHLVHRTARSIFVASATAIRRWLRWAAALPFVVAAGQLTAAEGLEAIRSPHGVAETMARLEQAVGDRGLNIWEIWSE